MLMAWFYQIDGLSRPAIKGALHFPELDGRRSAPRAARAQAWAIFVIWVGVGAGQPASRATRTIASLVSKYTCQ